MCRSSDNKRRLIPGKPIVLDMLQYIVQILEASLYSRELVVCFTDEIERFDLAQSTNASSKSSVHESRLVLRGDQADKNDLVFITL